MSKKGYRRTLSEAKQDLARHLVKRQKLDQKIARLHAVVTNLQNLCAEMDQKSFKNRVEWFIKKDVKAGITETMRVILQDNFFPMTASELKEQIEARKLQLHRYTNPLAVIHTILKRLVANGDVRVVLQPEGKKAYQWISSADKALSELQKSTQLPGKSGDLKEPK